MQPITVAFDGISGSGKGTQAELLIQLLKERDPGCEIIHFGMGNLLRAYLKESTQLAQRTAQVVNSGGLVPAVISNYLIARHFNTLDFKGTEHVLIDGAVRRASQAEAINDLMRFHGRTDLNVIVFDLPVHAAFERLKARGRSDDTEEAIANRAKWFQENAVPAIALLKDLGWKTHTINADQSIETVHADVVKVLGL